MDLVGQWIEAAREAAPTLFFGGSAPPGRYEVAFPKTNELSPRPVECPLLTDAVEKGLVIIGSP
jgi:hypothetical protein